MQLNHIFRSRDLMSKNDSKMANSQASLTDDVVNGNSLLDRGFTRPKVPTSEFYWCNSNVCRQ